jgi:hypothetical protein
VTDPFGRQRALLLLAARLSLAGVLQRIRDRAARGRELERWPLPKPEPSDPDSSLAADDAGFLTEIGGDYVRTTAIYPIMSATDCLSAIAQLVDDWETTKNSHMIALLTLCRSGVETAAKTIWMLSPADRSVRRARCVGLTHSEMSNQKSFHAIEVRNYETMPNGTNSPDYRRLQEHIRLFRVREEVLAREQKAKTPNETGYVVHAAKWIDKHPPAHHVELPPDGLAPGAERFYLIGSAFTHGYKWASDYVKRPQHAYGMVADGLAAAIAMADCAVALYEAQAQRRGAPTDRERRYPDRLEPTIAAWSTMYG